MFTRNKAHEAPIKTKRSMETWIIIMFDNIDMEKDACGGYNNKHKSMNEVVNAFIEVLINSFMR